MSTQREFIENLPETFPGGGYYISKELGAIMPCHAEQGRPDDVRSGVMQKIDTLAQYLENLGDDYSHSPSDSTAVKIVSEMKDAIKELNGQTILLLKLYCMDSHAIDRGNNDDNEEGRREERRCDGADQG